MMRVVTPLCLLVAMVAPAMLSADVPIRAFDDPSVWKPNVDGGHPPATRADNEFTQHGPALRIMYRDVAPHWGNLTSPCTVPATARALCFWVYRHAAQQTAAMHIWLFEPDGDGWVAQVRFEGKSLPDAPSGWNRVRLPLGAFRFDGRGTKTRQIGSANRMLIGCNYADLEVTLADMTWETGPTREAIPLPRTPGLKIEDGPTGRVGILDLGTTPPGFHLTHSPARLAEAVRAQGYGVTLLQAGDLADPQVLTRDHFDGLILPWGQWFPQQARETFLAYLKTGGSFLTLDGYAFDALALLSADGWLAQGSEPTAADLDKQAEQPLPEPMNTRTGKSGDAMTFRPEQIGLFDPGFLLSDATELHVSGEWRGRQGNDPAGTWPVKLPASGYAAVGLIGLNSPVFPDVYRRYIPVLNAFAGKSGAEGLRGPALGIMHNFAGVYAGSSWAFAGLTDGTDLFLDAPQRRALLGQVLREITARVYLHSLATEYACYEPDETVTLSFVVSNYGRLPAQRTYAVSVEGRKVGDGSLALAPGETKSVRLTFPCRQFDTDYCVVRASLSAPGTTLRDDLESAFCIRSSKVLAQGPKLAWRDNTMTVDGRPTFMVGSNQTGMMFYSPHEGPLVWERDFANMAAHNFHLLRILHFSPFSKGGDVGKPTNNPLDLATRPEKLVRQMDAIVQLAQKHRVAIFLSLHDWMGVTLTDEQLAAQADWNRFWAGRYRDVPGIFYDVQNEPSVDVPDRPDVIAAWNVFLRERYQTDEALRAAWHKSPPEAALPNVPLGKASADWDDVRAADLKRLQAELLHRWVKANVDGIRAGDPDALTCVGYLPSMPPADKMLGVRDTDFSNMHYYGSIDGFPLEFALIDRRFDGKGLSLGECGAQEDHARRNAGNDGLAVEDSIHRFQTYTHYAPMMGGAFIANWCWKDFDEAVFPWGLMHCGADVAKPWTYTWQQESLLLSLLQPKWTSPAVYILAPDRHRIGPHFDEIHNGIRRSVELLLDQRVSFAMINEESLDQLPPSARVLFWPLSYCPDDATFERVLAWVKAGGTLYFSGTVAFGPDRRPSRLERLADLGLPAVEPAQPFATPETAWSQSPLEARCGKGRVLFVPYPLELRAQDSDASIYRRVIGLARTECLAVEPAAAPVRAMSIDTADGGKLYMLARRSSGSELLTVTLPAAQTEVQLAEHGFAFVRVGARGDVLAAESQGSLKVGDVLVSRADSHYGICSLDGRDLRTSTQLLVLPHQCAQINLLRQVSGLSASLGRPGDQEEKPDKPGPAATLVFPPGVPGQVAVLAPPAQLPQTWQTVRDVMALRFRR